MKTLAELFEHPKESGISGFRGQTRPQRGPKATALSGEHLLRRQRDALIRTLRHKEGYSSQAIANLVALSAQRIDQICDERINKPVCLSCGTVLTRMSSETGDLMCASCGVV
jgi:hypothetical protein